MAIESAQTPDSLPVSKPKKSAASAAEQWYLIIHDLVYVLAFIILFFVFALRVVSVSGPSMLPTLVDKDYVALLSSVLYQEDDIRNGDVVVAIAPDFDTTPIVKRVIATAGQTVDIDFQKGIVYVDGVALDEPYIDEPTYTQFYGLGVKFPLTVDEGYVFLLGDNRNDSSDSRLAAIGQVSCENILGKVVFVLFPGAQNNVRDYGRIGIMD